MGEKLTKKMSEIEELNTTPTWVSDPHEALILSVREAIKYGKPKIPVKVSWMWRLGGDKWYRAVRHIRVGERGSFTDIGRHLQRLVHDMVRNYGLELKQGSFLLQDLRGEDERGKGFQLYQTKEDASDS